MKEEKIINYPLDIPFKEFMPGQLIVSHQFNDDMKDIESKVNETKDKHNLLVEEVYSHTEDLDNPHQVNPNQIGTYTSDQIDGIVIDIKSGNLDDNAIKNRVLDDGCVDNRTIQDNTITVSKVETFFGSQLDINNNMSITNRYTKEETDQIIQDKVGNGTYSKEELDQKFADVQAGQIVDGTIGADKVTSDFGANVNITNNPSIIDKVTNTQLNTTLGNYVTTITHSQSVNSLNNSIDSAKNDSINGDNALHSRIDEMQNNLGGSHNHNDLYSTLTHNHDITYHKKIDGTANVISKVIGGYPGICNESGGDDGWYRTTKGGLIPYQSGGYSAIGSSSWKFNEGWFNSLSAHTLNMTKNGNTSKINFSAQQNDHGFIEHYENNNSSRLRICVSDDANTSDEIQLGVAPYGTFQTNLASRGDGSLWVKSQIECAGYISIGGRRLYIGIRPSDAPNGSVSIG